eukprot:COSAG02_NODE_2022_length_10084_cov_2.725643_9_plen_141_part_00
MPTSDQGHAAGDLKVRRLAPAARSEGLTACLLERPARGRQGPGSLQLCAVVRVDQRSHPIDYHISIEYSQPVISHHSSPDHTHVLLHSLSLISLSCGGVAQGGPVSGVAGRWRGYSPAAARASVRGVRRYDTSTYASLAY